MLYQTMVLPVEEQVLFLVPQIPRYQLEVEVQPWLAEAQVVVVDHPLLGLRFEEPQLPAVQSMALLLLALAQQLVLSRGLVPLAAQVRLPVDASLVQAFGSLVGTLALQYQLVFQALDETVQVVVAHLAPEWLVLELQLARVVQSPLDVLDWVHQLVFQSMDCSVRVFVLVDVVLSVLRIAGLL